MANEQSTEDRLIAALFARHEADGKSVLTGPGDDAAVVRCPPARNCSLPPTRSMRASIFRRALRLTPQVIGHWP